MDANNFFSDQDYQNAIKLYQEALEITKNEEYHPYSKCRLYREHLNLLKKAIENKLGSKQSEDNEKESEIISRKRRALNIELNNKRIKHTLLSNSITEKEIEIDKLQENKSKLLSEVK